MKFVAPLATTIALAAGLVTAAADEQEDKVLKAAYVEWVVANCSGDVNGMAVAYSSMILAAAPAKQIEQARARFRDGVADNYPDTKAACDALLPQIAADAPAQQ